MKTSLAMKGAALLPLASILVSCAKEPAVGAKPADSDDTAVTSTTGLTFTTRTPYAVPDDLLSGADVQGCARFGDAVCEDGVTETCSLYDTTTGSWVDDPDPLLERVLMYERWSEDYNAPDGLTSDRDFNQAIPSGTPESVWGDPALFHRYDGFGDSGMWSSVRLHGSMLRYLETGTEADYARFEDQARAVIGLFEVTGIPGHLARSHFMMMDDPSAPNGPEHLMIQDPDWPSHVDHVVTDPAGLAETYTDADGTEWTGTRMWHGNPSIDQYTGPITVLPAAHALLRDPSLQSAITEHLTCYLKRLRRIEITNVQDNPDAIATTLAAFAQGGASAEDLEVFQDLDTIVFYGLPQPNSRNVDTYDSSCPDTLPTVADVTIDATRSTFVSDLLVMGLDVASGEVERETSLEHIYIPSLRSGDAMHLMNLAAIGAHLTGEEQYTTFMLQTLQTEIHTVDVAGTAGAFVMPRWCDGFYGRHITFPPWWAMLNLLDESPLRDEMASLFVDKLWAGEASDIGNAKFDLFKAGIEGGQADGAVTLLRELGGTGGELLEPRRRYERSYDDTVSRLPDTITPTCPTEVERATCEDGFSVLGVTVPGESISEECTGADSECVLSTGLCATAMADLPLPAGLRKVDDFVWQRNPFQLDGHSGDGSSQYPGLDLIESYWLARHYGLVPEGEGQVLAWRSGEACDAE
jgi:hypothetical protein